MKDKRTVGEKMARNSSKIAILLLLFVLNQTIFRTFVHWGVRFGVFSEPILQGVPCPLFPLFPLKQISVWDWDLKD